MLLVAAITGHATAWVCSCEPGATQPLCSAARSLQLWFGLPSSAWQVIAGTHQQAQPEHWPAQHLGICPPPGRQLSKVLLTSIHTAISFQQNFSMAIKLQVGREGRDWSDSFLLPLPFHLANDAWQSSLPFWAGSKVDYVLNACSRIDSLYSCWRADLMYNWHAGPMVMTTYRLFNPAWSLASSSQMSSRAPPATHSPPPSLSSLSLLSRISCQTGNFSLVQATRMVRDMDSMVSPVILAGAQLDSSLGMVTRCALDTGGTWRRLSIIA